MVSLRKTSDEQLQQAQKEIHKLGLLSHVYFTNLNAISNYTQFIKMVFEGA
jgi:hypothetical protein